MKSFNNDKTKSLNFDIFPRLALALMFLFVCGGLQAQSYNTDYSSKTVTTRPAMWYDYSEYGNYGQSGMTTALDDASVAEQIVHTYVDTIYMHKGSSIELRLPFVASNAYDWDYKEYYRWYNFRTGGNFYNGSSDLLTPNTELEYIVGPYYRVANGYLGGLGIATDSHFGKADFYYPYDSEFSSYNTKCNTNNKYYVIACDYSNYDDYTASGSDSNYPTIGENDNVVFFDDTNTGWGNNNGKIYAWVWDAKNNNTNYTGNNWPGEECTKVDGYEHLYKWTYTKGGSFTPTNVIFNNGDAQTSDLLYVNGNVYSKFGFNQPCEPTLMGRVLYYIIGIEDSESDVPEEFRHVWEAVNDPAYQGGTNEGNEKYLEEYDITFPSRHSAHSDELVGLSKDARAYVLPLSSTDNVTSLDVKLIDTDDQGLQLTSDPFSIDGFNRAISFYKGTKSNDDTEAFQWEVKDGSTAVILVTKEVNHITYNIARYKLTFKKSHTPLTDSQVAVLDDIYGTEGTTGKGNHTEWFSDFSYRSPKYLSNNFEPRAMLTFDDYNAHNSYEVFGASSPAESFSAFPIDWDYTGYGFNNGTMPSRSGNGGVSDTDDPNERVNAAQYAVMSNYYGWDDNGTVAACKAKSSGGSWFYVDGTQTPGTICELPIGTSFCVGTQLFVTAWMKGCNRSDPGSDTQLYRDDSSVIMTVKGIDDNGEHVPICSFSSGQIRRTDGITPYSDDGTSSGKGGTENEWMQIAFEFTVDADHPYNSYTLQLQNYSASSDGADFYFDDLMVYVVHPEYSMTKIVQSCDEDEGTYTADFDFDALSIYEDDGVDHDTNPYDYAQIDYVVINENRFDAFKEANANNYADDDALTAAAIDYAAITITNGDDGDYSEKFPVFNYYYHYESNAEYDEDNKGNNMIALETKSGVEGVWLYRRTDETTNKSLVSIDFHSCVMAYVPYKLIAVAHTDGETETDVLEAFAAALNDESGCSLLQEFYFESTTEVRFDGEKFDPTETVCAGQSNNISVHQTYIWYDSDGTEHTQEILEYSYNDFYYGTEEDYLSSDNDYSISPKAALAAFRALYPYDGDLAQAQKDGYSGESWYKLIDAYVKDGTLVLRKHSVEVYAENSGDNIYLVIQPIPMTDDDLAALDPQPDVICFAYIPIVIKTDGKAPELLPGFADVEYPSDHFVPYIRLGKAQLDSGEVIKIDVRGGKVYNGGTKLGKSSDDGVYLVSTTDPAYHEILDDDDFKRTDFRVGAVNDISGTPNSYDRDNNDMELDFNVGSGIDFDVKEGYSYVLQVYFIEEGGTTDEDAPNCPGSVQIELIIVPEYVVWQGDETDNWNRDGAWKVATQDDLKGLENYDGSTGEGYVPMLFTSVVIPEDTKAQLYENGFKKGVNDIDLYSWQSEASRPDDIIIDPTQNIMYDMMVYEDPDDGSLATQRYRVNLCNDIHLAAGAQMLHSELLIYNNASADVQLTANKWNLVSLPLQDVYAGDWYARKAADSIAPYFTDVTFSGTSYAYSRFNPDVYQRSWSEGTGVSLEDNSGNPYTATTAWTSAYNDAATSYKTGEGFSVKVYDDGLTFRFPKADTSYDYYTTSNSVDTKTDTSSGTLNKTNAGRLLASDLVSRTAATDKDDSSAYTGDELSVSLSSENGYFLVGNPFAAPMSLNEFFTENTALTGSYWLSTENGPVYGTSNSCDTAADGNLTSLGTTDCLVAPYGAFFAQATSDVNSVTVKFNEDMQTFGSTDSGNAKAMTIRAQGAGGMSAASVVYSAVATDEYDASEDAILLSDASWQSADIPMVYTVAGNTAVGVNRIKDMTVIPLGVFAAADSGYLISFSGTDSVLSPVLYDALLDTKTQLNDDTTLSLTGSSHGRYFILTSGSSATGISETATDSSVSVYSPAKRSVTVSGTGIESVEVYSVGGALQKRVKTAGAVSANVDGVDSGVAIVRVITSEGTTVKKISVK